MLRIGFVTCATLPHLTPDDQLAAAELAARGVAVQAVVWDGDPAAWRGLEALVLRSTWDYHLQPERFRAWLEDVNAAGVRLFNPPDTVRWNMHKGYLADLATRGVAIAPTRWLTRGNFATLADILVGEGWARAVVKPAISASAHKTWRVDALEAASLQPRLEDALAESDLLVQPFLEEVQKEGEWSLLFFGRQFSHAVLKRTAEDDFRVQNEYGGNAVPLAADPGLVAQAAGVLAVVDGPLVYARVDGVVRGGVFTLMELELIEPYLFLSTDTGAAGRFAAAIVEAL